MGLEDLVREVERLRVADDEVLIVRPKSILTRAELERLHRNLAHLARACGWPRDRIVVLDRDFDLTVVKAEQVGMAV